MSTDRTMTAPWSTGAVCSRELKVSAVGVLGRPRSRPLCPLDIPQAAGAGRRSSQSVVRAGELS